MKKLGKYLWLTFAITYSCWWGLALLTKLQLLDSADIPFKVLHVLGGFGPTIAAILVLPDKSPKATIKFVFSREKGSIWYLVLLCLAQAAVIGLSSLQTNPMIPWIAIPFIMLSATFLGGGNEELGWRGIMQPELEKRFPFPIATLFTGCTWMAWHIPLWFVEGTSQQDMNFVLYCVYGIFLSFLLGTLYKKTKSVFFCTVFHGFSNLLISLFLIRINAILVIGLLVILVLSIWLYYKMPKSQEKISIK